MKKAKITARMVKIKKKKIYLWEESQNDGILIPESTIVFTNAIRLDCLQLKQGDAIEITVRKIPE